MTSDSQPWPRPAVGWYAVGVLLLAFLFSFVDRTILGLLVVPIKADLGLSDAAMGLLLGFAFSLVFTLMAAPWSWLSDRFSRRNIVSIAVLMWSLATAACGLTRSFAQLLLARTGVAAGEAALSPAAFSIISDYFPREKLGRALGVYMAGAFFGAGAAFLLGAAALSLVAGMETVEFPVVGELKPWQLTFMIVGLPGVAVALLALTLPEPVRRGVSKAHSAKDAVFRFMLDRRRIFGTHYVGFGLLAVVIVVVLNWGPTMFVRTHGFSQPEVGFKLGLILLCLSPAGVFAGGWLADAWQKSGRPDAPLRVGIVAALASLPFTVSANLVNSADLALVLYCPLVFFSSLAVACAPAAIQMVTPNQLRAQVSAGYMISLNIIGSICGPTGVGFATDFLFRDELAVGSSMALVSGICAPLAAFLLWLGCRPYREARAAADAG